jgi:hypothetical protein
VNEIACYMWCTVYSIVHVVTGTVLSPCDVLYNFYMWYIVHGNGSDIRCIVVFVVNGGTVLYCT